MTQTPDDFFVPIHKGQDLVFDADVGAELSHQDLQIPQIVSRDAGEQVVDRLELQTAVEEIQPGGTVDVHGGAELVL